MHTYSSVLLTVAFKRKDGYPRSALKHLLFKKIIDTFYPFNLGRRSVVLKMFGEKGRAV